MDRSLLAPLVKVPRGTWIGRHRYQKPLVDGALTPLTDISPSFPPSLQQAVHCWSALLRRTVTELYKCITAIVDIVQFSLLLSFIRRHS